MTTRDNKITQTNNDMTRRRVLGTAGASLLAGGIMTSLTASAAVASAETISHVQIGSGPNRVIVLHDWSVSGEGDYMMLKPFLNTTNFTWVFADVRGYGGSIAMRGKFTVAEISSDVAALAAKLGWDRFSIMGHSMTGMAVQRVMADMPAKLISVVATVPVPASGFPLDDKTFGFFESMATNDDAFRQGMHALTSGHYGEEWVNFKLAQNRRLVSGPAMKAYTTMWSRGDFSKDVKGNKTPIMVVYGAHDNEGLRQSASGAKFKSWYPNLTEHVATSGHYPMIEAPVAYAKTVQDYLAKMHA